MVFSNEFKEPKWFKSNLNLRRIWYFISLRIYWIRESWEKDNKAASNEEQLSRLWFFSLAKRRIRGDIIDIYKIMTGMDRTNSMDWLLSLPVQGLLPIRWNCCSQTQNSRRGIFMQWEAVNSLPKPLEIPEDYMDSRTAWISTGKRDL